MVSVTTLENVKSMEPLLPALNGALFWWKIALIPTLLGVPPVKEFGWGSRQWYEVVRMIKVVLLWSAIVLIFIGIGHFLRAS
jgi:hypothetical protein